MHTMLFSQSSWTILIKEACLTTHIGTSVAINNITLLLQIKDVILISLNRVILIGRVSNLFLKSKVNLFKLNRFVVPNTLRRTSLQLTYVTYLSMTLKFIGSHLSYFPLSGESQFCSFLFFFYTCLHLPIFILWRAGGLWIAMRGSFVILLWGQFCS